MYYMKTIFSIHYYKDISDISGKFKLLVFFKKKKKNFCPLKFHKNIDLKY